MDDFLARLNDQEQHRYQKTQRWRARGVNPYPLRVSRTHTARQTLDAFARGEALSGVQLAGRLIALREMGKLAFAHLQDGTAKIQLLFRKDAVGAENYATLVKDFDLGDFIGVEGEIVRTKTGEITLQVTRFELLAKTLSPLPEKWHGLKDTETRYRQRYLDLLSNEPVREIFVKRSKIITAMRTYLDEHGFLEVETPVLQPLYGGGAAEPFVTHHNKLDRDMYLRIADELYLKRLLVGGIERVYEISKDFRNEGIDFKHNPEFTMMECYQAYGDYTTMMTLVEELYAACSLAANGTLQITYQGHAIDLTPPWPRATMRDLILKTSGVDIYADADLPALRQRLAELNLKVEAKPTWGKQVDELFSVFAEPTLIQPTFVMDYPEEISPFAKKKPDTLCARVVERFEAFSLNMELGNAFTELNDPLDQYARFVEQSKQRDAGDKEAHPVDLDFIEALMHGMPPTGGLGVGVDRMVMLLTDQSSIREVILFPQLRT
ncbi:MAG: lysine--tRNA ligase [Chloroflexi bacterium]|nr:lysine--tRNA ligase [Chloroflexota bacterium]